MIPAVIMETGCILGGVGNDPRPNRAFNLEKQAEYYDPDEKFRKLWLS